MTDTKRLTFSRWFQGIAMSALGVIALWVGSSLRDLNVNLARLSEQVSILNTKAERDREDMRELKDRVRVLEGRR